MADDKNVDVDVVLGDGAEGDVNDPGAKADTTEHTLPGEPPLNDVPDPASPEQQDSTGQHDTEQKDQK